EGAVPGVTGEIRSVYEEADGRVWLGTTSDGVVRLTPPAAWSGGSTSPAPAVERYGEAEGLPGLKYTRIRAIAGAPIFATQKGVFRYDEASRRFAPDPRFASLFPDAPRWVAGPRVD